MAEENAITVSKDVLYGSIIVVLALLLVGSIITHGYGIIPCEAAAEPAKPQAEPEPSVPAPAPEPEPTEPAAPEAIPTLTVDLGTNPALGDEDAPVAIIEFSDFQCPFCGKLYNEAGAQVRANYVETGKVRHYFNDFPLPFHPNAGPTSLASRCAGAQGQFWEMHDKLFDTQSEWSPLENVTPIMKEYAADLGLDTTQFNDCYDAVDYLSEIQAAYTAGQRAGVQGTPSSFIIIPKGNIDEATITGVMSALASKYGGGPTLFENDNEYIVMIPGAYPYEVFDAILSAVNY